MFNSLLVSRHKFGFDHHRATDRQYIVIFIIWCKLLAGLISDTKIQDYNSHHENGEQQTHRTIMAPSGQGTIRAVNSISLIGLAERQESRLGFNGYVSLMFIVALCLLGRVGCLIVIGACF